MGFIVNKEQEILLDRFLRYVKVWSESDSVRADQGIQPSTDRQWDFARILASELTAAGASGVTVTDHCYVYGLIEPSPGFEKTEPVCLIAHMDTVEEVTGKDVKPVVHRAYSGAPISLNEDIILDPAEDAHLALAKGETVITTDGTTLLGADDKAGIAAIMSAVSYLNEHPSLSHGPIEVLFSPDEETGHGMDNVPLDLIRSKSACTVDGGHIGEIETECFNAYKSEIIFTGVSTHTGTARSRMVNAVTMAAAFTASLPRHEAPETTDGFQGFYAPMTISGSIESAHVTIFLRDFTSEGMEKRKALVTELAKTTALTFGGKAECIHTEQYRNMKDGLEKNPAVVHNLVKACEASGVTCTFPPIRGGTDGSRLTEMGRATPNLFTGGHNYHSRKEWCSLEQMAKAADVLIHFALITAEKK